MMPFQLHPWYLLNAKCWVSSGFFSLDKLVELEISSVLPFGNQTCSTENPSTIYSFLFPINTHIGDFPLPGLFTDRSVRIARASKKGGRFLRRSEKKWLKRSSWRSRMPPGSKKKLPWTHEMNSAPWLRLDKVNLGCGRKLHGIYLVVLKIKYPCVCVYIYTLIYIVYIYICTHTHT